MLESIQIAGRVLLSGENMNNRYTALLVSILALGSSTAFAQEITDPSVKIVSVVSNPYRSHEVCGTVEGAAAQWNTVKIITDTAADVPKGTYYALAGPDGKFCVMVMIYRGGVKATVVGPTGNVLQGARLKLDPQ